MIAASAKCLGVRIGCGVELAFHVVPVEELANVADERDAIAADVIDTAHERAHGVCTGLCCEERLRGAEHERRRDANAVGCEPGRRPEAILDHRHLDHDVVRDLRELLAVAIACRRR